MRLAPLICQLGVRVGATVDLFCNRRKLTSKSRERVPSLSQFSRLIEIKRSNWFHASEKCVLFRASISTLFFLIANVTSSTDFSILIYQVQTRSVRSKRSVHVAQQKGTFFTLNSTPFLTIPVFPVTRITFTLRESLSAELAISHWNHLNDFTQRLLTPHRFLDTTKPVSL